MRRAGHPPIVCWPHPVVNLRPAVVCGLSRMRLDTVRSLARVSVNVNTGIGQQSGNGWLPHRHTHRHEE
ncbi:hypothetical protein ADILRU_0535 [Leifsonia rubra CMS 76R]|nr:hypothetical protein ADILRU_0535 [Leifsonia rubra CMS 76R]